MRSTFPGYYPPSCEEFDQLWSVGLIAVDANTLLNLYRYTESTRTEFLAALRSLNDRLWLPHEVGLEFQRNRLGVIDQQVQAFDGVLKAIESSSKTVAGEMSRYRKHASLNVEDLLAAYESALKPLLERIDQAKNAHVELAPEGPHVDPIWDAVTEIFSYRVGTAFTSEELASICTEGEDG